MKRLRTTFFRQGTAVSTLNMLTEESTLTLVAGEEELVTLSCTGKDLRELVYGYLYSSGIIGGVEAVKAVNFDPTGTRATIELTEGPSVHAGKRKDHPTGNGGAHNRANLFTVSAGILLERMTEFQGCSDEFRNTGGVHSAALCTRQTGIVVFYEDLGRHNAIDKVIGKALMTRIGMTDKFLLFSGRMPLEIVRKVIAAGIPLVASPGPPTAEAVKLAREQGITLVGFVKKDRMTLYSHPERVRGLVPASGTDR